MRIALFPGSFDPVTKGHENVVLRALPLFDKIVIAVGRHGSKKGMFSLEDRLAMLHAAFGHHPNIEVTSYEGLTADFCIECGATVQLRGVRNGVDLNYEQTLAQMTRAMHPELDTVILLTDPEHAAIHSSVVRDVLVHKGNVKPFVPEAVWAWMNQNM